MASEVIVPSAVAYPPAVKLPLMPLVLCCVLAVLLAVGGALGVMFLMARSGKLGGGATATTTVVVKEASVPTHNVPLEPLLANLADEGGHAYLRLGVVLEEEDDPIAKKGKEEAGKPVAGADAAVRDTVFEVLGRQNSAALLQPDGKQKLKEQLKAAIGTHNADLRVKAIYFTDFLVQR